MPASHHPGPAPMYAVAEGSIRLISDQTVFNPRKSTCSRSVIEPREAHAMALL
jgi:hypothetical protein